MAQATHDSLVLQADCLALLSSTSKGQVTGMQDRLSCHTCSDYHPRSWISMNLAHSHTYSCWRRSCSYLLVLLCQTVHVSSSNIIIQTWHGCHQCVYLLFNLEKHEVGHFWITWYQLKLKSVSAWVKQRCMQELIKLDAKDLAFASLGDLGRHLLLIKLDLNHLSWL